jgi:hypothetical protein
MHFPVMYFSLSNSQYFQNYAYFCKPFFSPILHHRLQTHGAGKTKKPTFCREFFKESADGFKFLVSHWKKILFQNNVPHRMQWRQWRPLDLLSLFRELRPTFQTYLKHTRYWCSFCSFQRKDFIPSGV